MRLKLLAPADGGQILASDSANARFDDVARLLERARRQGHSCTVIDSLGLSYEERMDYVEQAWMWTTQSHRRLRATIGTATLNISWYFGSQVPVLLGYEGERQGPIGVFPHDTKGGPVWTIAAFLRELTRGASPAAEVAGPRLS